MMWSLVKSVGRFAWKSVDLLLGIGFYCVGVWGGSVLGFGRLDKEGGYWVVGMCGRYHIL